MGNALAHPTNAIMAEPFEMQGHLEKMAALAAEQEYAEAVKAYVEMTVPRPFDCTSKNTRARLTKVTGHEYEPNQNQDQLK